MDRPELTQRIVLRSGMGFDEAERALDAVLGELCSAAARRQRLDLGPYGVLEPEPGHPGARLLPGRTPSAFGAHRRE